MSLLILPDNVLLRITEHLPSFPTRCPTPWIGPDDKTPLLGLDYNLRSLCATDRRLRALFTPALYNIVVLNLEKDELEMQHAILMSILHHEAEIVKHVRCVSLWLSWMNL